MFELVLKRKVGMDLTYVFADCLYDDEVVKQRRTPLFVAPQGEVHVRRGVKMAEVPPLPAMSGLL